MGPMPPWHQYRGLLSPQDHADLLDYTLANRARFTPLTLSDGVVDPARRVSQRLRDLGPMRARIEARLRDMLPDILHRCGTQSFDPDEIQLEIAAHRDGAFFVPHSDLPVGPGRERLAGDARRRVGGVYYYHREPKGFSGGALRLLRFGGGDRPGDFVDIEPEQNSLVVFPFWAVHEVRKVRCPGGDFADSRFAVNIWLCKPIER